MILEYAASRTAFCCFQQQHLQKKRDQKKSKSTACLPQLLPQQQHLRKTTTIRENSLREHPFL
eukprot:9987044-Ditylum_brightwellii.AAC.1